MKKYTMYRQQLQKSNKTSTLYNTQSQFSLHSNIDQRQFYLSSQSNIDNMTTESKSSIIGKPMLLIMDNSKLSEEGMEC